MMITFFIRQKCWSVFGCLTRQDVTPNFEKTKAILKKKRNQILIQWKGRTTSCVNQQFWKLFDSFIGNFDLNTLERANDISENRKKKPDDRIANLEVMLSKITTKLFGTEQLANMSSGTTEAPNTELKNEYSCEVCSSFRIE